MYGRFSNPCMSNGSSDQAFESASACASFYAALLLLVDTVLAVSIFVSGDVSLLLGGVLACVPVLVLRLRVLRVLISPAPARRSKPLAVSI